MTRHFFARLLMAGAALAALAGTGGCSSHSNAPNTAVGVGITLGTSGSTSLVPGGSVTIAANVLNDPNAAGVIWTLSGLGTLSGRTKTTVVYTAPASLNGTATATITATSASNSIYYANLTAVTTGAPVLQQQTILPANQHNGYGTTITAFGGVAPYAWRLVAGQLPPGLVLNGTTGAQLGISGTPTAAGTFSFTLQVTDGNSQIAKGNYTIVVNPQPSCLLSGTFAYNLHGFSKTGAPASRAGWFTVDADGNVKGMHTLKSDIGVTVDEAIVSGTCMNQALNRGTINLNTANSGTLIFDWALLSSLDEGYLQELDGSGIAGTATLARIDYGAISLDRFAGDQVFGVVGSNGTSAVRLGVVGRLTLSPSGVVSAGLADDNGPLGTSASGSTVTGSASALTPPTGAPPGAWHGNLTLNVGGTPLNFAYYAVSSVTGGRRLYLIETGSMGTPILVGDMVAQGAGLGAASLAPPATSTAPAVPAIMAFIGATGTHYPDTRTELARLSNGNPTAGTVDLLLDDAIGATVTYATSYVGSAYSVASNGRATLKIGTGASARTFVGYLYGTSAGFLVETTAGSDGGFMLLEPQSGFPYTQFLGGSYLASTILPGTISPISLLPSVTIQGGTIGGGFTGQYALDATTGRGLAEVTRSLFGGTGIVFYIVSENRIVLMGNGANALNPQLGLMTYSK